MTPCPLRYYSEPMSETAACIVCGSEKHHGLFSKAGPGGEDEFNLVECDKCGLRFVSPRPTVSEILKYYDARYFTTRTDRGYNDYFSMEVRAEIERIISLNLADLGFFAHEGKYASPRRSLDIGCAAGYFVNFMKKRGWDAEGIDVSADCVDFAAQRLGLNVTRGDYLTTGFTDRFDLISLWATIEHLHHPDRFLMKIREDLVPGGMLYISTCRIGGINFMKLYGKHWRYYNFPEHLYFFSRKTIKKLLERCGFRMMKYRTYGSGFGNPGSVTRKVADFCAKNLYMGDMMLIAAEKDL